VEPWTPLGEMVALMQAESLDELYRRLVLWPPVRRKGWDALEGWCLFHKFHQHDQDGAATTAVLLVTDSRWHRAAGRLLEQITESGLVPAQHLDLLAESFVAAERRLYWEAPDDWFTGPEIVIEFGGDGPEPCVDDAPQEERGPTVVPRVVRPPLRRWAAARLVEADPSRWGPLVARAGELDSRGGAAVMRGVLDVADVLVPKARGALVAMASVWTTKDVREAARQLRHDDQPFTTSGSASTPLAGADRAAATPTRLPQPSLF